MVSADASGFVERALESASSAALLRDEPTATRAVVGSSLAVHQLNSSSHTHTLFSSSFPDPMTMMTMEWSVFGEEDTAADSSVVVVASRVVESNDKKDVDVFLSFVFHPNAAVDAIIQYGDGDSAHEVVLERFRMTGGKAIPLESYNSATTETHAYSNGKSSVLLFYHHTHSSSSSSSLTLQ